MARKAPTSNEHVLINNQHELTRDTQNLKSRNKYCRIPLQMTDAA